jgi:hypothetical protein
VDEPQTIEAGGLPQPARDLSSLRGVIWWRFGVAAATLVAAAALIAPALLLNVRGDEWGPLVLMGSLMISGGLLASLGLPSLLIALGLRRASRAAVRWALVHDLLILVFSVVQIILTLRQPYGWSLLWLLIGSSRWVVLGLTFGAEAAYLVRAVWKWRPAWFAYGLFAAGLLSAVTILPGALHSQRAHDIKPLLAYVNAHWVKTPAGARLSLSRRAAGPGTHTDYVSVRGEELSWSLSAEHRADGRWVLPKPRGYDYTLQCSFNPPVARRLFTSDHAKALLLNCGVVDTNLEPARTITPQTPGGLREYEFRSPLGKGYYRVGEVTSAIRFYLEQPVEVVP